MKRILVTLMSLVMIVSMAVPVATTALLVNVGEASAVGVTTDVTVASGSGAIPIVKAKWEQDITASLEDGDTGHTTNMSQFLPPLTKCGIKTIKYFFKYILLL